jgi:hypothetical protein
MPCAFGETLFIWVVVSLGKIKGLPPGPKSRIDPALGVIVPIPTAPWEKEIEVAKSKIVNKFNEFVIPEN